MDHQTGRVTNPEHDGGGGKTLTSMRLANPWPTAGLTVAGQRPMGR
jgi:hypothetical protein